jgi:hypothetical protein
VVARQLGKVCLVGCSELAIDASARRCRIAGRELTEGDWLCLDGNGGRVLAGRPELVTCRPTEWLRRVEGWKGRRGDSIPATAGEFAQGGQRACSTRAASGRRPDSAGIGEVEQRVQTSSVVTGTCTGQATPEEVGLRSWTTGIGPSGDIRQASKTALPSGVSRFDGGHSPLPEMRIIACVTDAPVIQLLGEPTTLPRAAPARGPPLWSRQPNSTAMTPPHPRLSMCSTSA